MDITTTQEQARIPVTVVKVNGDIDTHTYEQFEQCLQQLIAGGARNILVDLAQVRYVSSAGIRALTQALRWLQAANADQTDADVSRGVRDGTFHSPHLKLANASKSIIEVFTTTGVDMVLDLQPDVASALRAF